MRRSLLLACLLLSPLAAAPDDVIAARITGVRFIAETDQDNKVRPFNWPAGYVPWILVPLPDTAIKNEVVRMTTVVTDNGEDLILPNRQNSGCALSKDGRIAQLYPHLKLPSAKARGIKLLEGSMRYVAAGATEDQDVGTLHIEEGATGKNFGAKVSKIAKSRWDPKKQSFKLSLNLNPHHVKAIVLKGPDGSDLDIQQVESAFNKDSITYTFQAESLPASVKATVTLYTNIETVTRSFSLSNVDLLGRPVPSED